MQHLQKPRVKTKYIIDETADPSFNTMLLQVCVVDEFASQVIDLRGMGPNRPIFYSKKFKGEKQKLLKY